MRAREFIVEQRAELDPGIKYPMHHTFFIPGIRNNDPYHSYRLGTAMARARAELGDETDHFPEFTTQSAFGQNAVVVGFNDSVDAVIDKALQMTGTQGGKTLVSSLESEEPPATNTHSPVRGFKGYPR